MYKSKNNKGKNIEFLPLLFLRLILAYGFYNPALQKLQNINGIGEWFESMGNTISLSQCLYGYFYGSLRGDILVSRFWSKVYLGTSYDNDGGSYKNCALGRRV